MQVLPVTGGGLDRVAERVAEVEEHARPGLAFVEGDDAGRMLNQISGNNVDGEPNQITYTQWLNARGTLEADLTVTKLADDSF